MNSNGTVNSPSVDCLYLKYDLENRLSTFVSSIICSILNAIFSVPAVLGNSLLILAIWRTPGIQSASVIILCSIACGDLLNGFLAQPLFVVYQVSEIHRNLEIVCVSGLVWNYVCWLSCGTSGLGLTLLSLERYLAVKLHLRYHDFITPIRIKVAAVFPWVVMGTYAAIRFIDGGNRVAIIAIAPLIFSSLMVIAFCNYKILQFVRHHQTKIEDQTRALSRLGPKTKPQINVKKFKKSAIVTAWVVGVYWVATVPVLCIMLVYSIHGFTTRVRIAYNAALTLSSLNSSANFAICYWRMREIRKAVARIFTKSMAINSSGETLTRDRRRSTRHFKSERLHSISRDNRPIFINVRPANNLTDNVNNRFLSLPPDNRY